MFIKEILERENRYNGAKEQAKEKNTGENIQIIADSTGVKFSMQLLKRS